MINRLLVFVLVLCGLVPKCGDTQYLNSFPQDDALSLERVMQQIEADVRNVQDLHGQSTFSIRRTDLEEELIDLQYIVKSSKFKSPTKIPVSCIRVVDLRLGGFKTEGGFITAAAVDLDDAPLWRAAYDCFTHKVFHLYGFPDDESGFNALMTALDLRLNSESDALVLGRDFVRLTSHNDRTVVRDELSLMSAFVQDYQGKRDLKTFYSAWNKCPARVKKQLSPPSVRVATEGYEIMFFLYTNKVLTKTSLLVQTDGTLAASESKSLFTWLD